MLTNITPEILADLETPRDLRLSQCGRHAVWALRAPWTRKDYVVSSLWMGEVGKPNSAKRLTMGTYNDSGPQFSPDGRLIAFNSDRANQGKASALYILPIDGGEAWPLTSTNLESGVGAFKWSPDGRSIAFVSGDEKSEVEKKKIELKDDAKIWGEDWPFGRLRIVSIDSKEVTTLFSDSVHVADFAWSSDGHAIAFSTIITPLLDNLLSGPTAVQSVDVQSRKVVSLCRYPTLVASLVWEKDTIMWIGRYDSDFVISAACVYSTSATPGKGEFSRLAYGVDSCCQELRHRGDGIVAYVHYGLSDQLQILGSKTLYNEEHKLGAWDTTINGENITLAIIKSSVNGPPEVFSVVEGKTCQLSQHNQDVAGLGIGRGSRFTDIAADKTPLDGIICLPTSLSKQSEKARGPHKTIVLVHGGPYMRFSKDFDAHGFHWSAWLLSLGYVLLCANYRGGAGHGNEYAKAVRGKPAASYPDIIDLVKKGIAEGIIDEKRVAIAGWSQGGYLSYLAVTRDSSFHFAAAICGAGVTDWDLIAATSDLTQVECAIGGGSPWMSEATDTQGRDGSPIYHMQNIHTPVLILHGEKDDRVPVSQATAFHRGMIAKGKECEMVIYPREDHGYPNGFERAHFIHMLNKMKEFLEKHV